MQSDPEVIDILLDGPAHRYADPIADAVPSNGAGIYTVWDEHGEWALYCTNSEDKARRLAWGLTCA